MRRFLFYMLPMTVAVLGMVACGPEVSQDPAETFALGQRENVAVADPAEALTFARVERDGVTRVIAVTRYAGGTIEGVDLSLLLEREVTDPITLFLEEGYDPLRQALLQAPPETRVAEPAVGLVIPVDLGDRHIAAGTNFPEHAGEADVEDGPFLFAKRVRPTGPRAPVSAGEALLDYEVELAWVTLEPLAEGDRPAFMGLILCNDYTDRDALMRLIDVSDIPSGKGFATGKSFPGFLPVGDLFVVPRDHRAFAEARELRLYVNDSLRQQSALAAQVWDIDEIIAQTWARRDVTWDHRGEQVSLLDPSGVIPARTLLMSGTPAGTVFQGVDLGPRLSGLRAWILGGWDRPVTQHVIEAYLREAHAEGRYLQPGDRVTVHVDAMGVIDNEIIQ